MFKTKNSRGFSIPEIAVGVAILGMLAGTVYLAVIPLQNNSRDSRVMGDLKTMSQAVQVYMSSTNGTAPCIDNITREGAAAWASGSACAGNTYDIQQGANTTPGLVAATGYTLAGGGADYDLNENGVAGELLTAGTVMSRSLTQVPESPYKGDTYLYTKGINSNSELADSFAFSGLLRSNSAAKKVRANTSILNASAVTNFDNATLVNPASLTDITANLRAVSTATNQVVWGTSTPATVLATDAVSAHTNDLYSDGLIKDRAFNSAENATVAVSIGR